MNRLISLVAMVAFALTLSAPALADVDFTGQVATTLQSLESDTGVSQDEEVGFGDALFNLQVRGDVAEGVTGFAEVHNNAQSHLIDVPSPEILLFGGANRDPNDIDLREAYITFHDMFPHAYLKVGRVDLKYGTQYKDRSVNARVQDNPLIGNHLNDFGGPETGLHVGGEFPLQAANLGIDWYAAVTNGTREANVNEGQSLAFTGSLGFEIFSAGYLKGSYHRVSHDDVDSTSDLSSFGVAEGENYYLTQFDLGPPIGSLEFPSSSLSWFTSDLRAWQVDGKYHIEDANLKLSGYVGNFSFEEDNALFDSAEADYWNAQADWMFSARSGLAGRYGEFDFEDGALTFTWDRLQVGLRHRYRENVLAKLEYVDQAVEVGSDSLTEFDGVVGELSIAF